MTSEIASSPAPESGGGSDAWLWSPPDEIVAEPPTVTELESLPLDKLSFRDAERLFLCLLESVADVSYAKSYGTVGQAQQGIDVYGWLRLPPTQEDGHEHRHAVREEEREATASPLPPRRYASLQSKRVKVVKPSDIKNAVTKFLEGSWADQSIRFYYATTFDFRGTDLDEAIREQTERLQARSVEFIPWDAERINELLRDRPRLVARFFGPHWVEPFCGKNRFAELPASKLDPTETRLLRTELHGLYEAAFVAVASLRPTDTDDNGPFVILDALPRPEATSDTWVEAGGSLEATEQVSRDEDAADSSESHSDAPSALRRPRRSLRSVRALLDDRRGPASIGDAIAADIWLADGNRNLLIGAPGAGKSSLLRFIATDLLASEPTSVALQRRHGDRLPVWLPFGFLCHHLDANDSNSLTSAVQAWLTSHSRPDLYPLVAKALEDDRLLLLIDGIDEWTTESTAGKALARLETFLGSTEAAIILTSRPYALAHLPFNLTWRRADIAPLDADQQRRVARQYLIPGKYAGTSDDASTFEATHASMWSKSNVQPFIAQLTAVPELQTFTRTPLLLALLARSWQGEPLPARRFDLYNLIVKMLVDTHPKMRARASNATDQPLHTSDFLTLIQAVAYSLKADETPQPVPSKTMQKLIESALADEDILGYDKSDAHKMAAEAMAMAEDEFGILVPQGAKHVGFIHRVIGDHLAGCHLAELTPEAQLDIFVAKHGDAAWTDVLLAALNAQPNKHTVAHSVDAIVNGVEALNTAMWPQDVLRTQAAWRFIGAALASDVNLAPWKARELLDRVVSEVETSPSLTYRATLITTLVDAGATASNWRHLLPVFRRWLDATRPSPSAAMWALHELPADLDDRIRRIVVQGMRHEDGNVRSGAIDAFAARYGNPKAVDPAEAPAETRPVDPDLLEVFKTGPDARTQTAALMALVEGWPLDEVTWEHVEWARRTPKSNLRTGALFAIAQADKTTRLRDLLDADEFDFVMAYLYQEGRSADDHDWTGMNSVLVTRAVTEASDEDKHEFAEFAVTTLRQNPMGEGNRQMCWQLACGPLKNHNILRDWVIEELNDTNDKRPLILYDLNQMPETWLEYEPMKEALNSGADDLLDLSWHSNVKLARALRHDQARTALLKAIDRFRPAGAARELVERFGDDPIVVEELDKRFTNDKSAAALSGIAIQHLGPMPGFTRIYNLLKDFNAYNPHSAAEPHVVVALAVAHGWHALSRAAAGEDTDTPLRDDARGQGLIDPELAAEVLAAYDDDEIAAACIAVPTRRGLGWHIAEIIHTWPSHTIDYTLAELHRNDHITSGLTDPIHATALRAHANRPSPRSTEVLDLALDLLNPLPPELREVLAHELTRAPISPVQLLDVTSAWVNDPDEGVRRNTAVGITQAVLRHHQPETLPRVELTEWSETVRAQLCAYGPNHEEDRQIAWTCMLLLGAPELLDGQLETIGEATPPGVRLTDIYGNPDELLVELIAQNWEILLPHLEKNPLRQLTDARPKSEAHETRALRSLLVAATNSPAIAELIQRRITTEEAEGAKSPTRELLETTPGGIDHLIATHGGTTANLYRVINASDGDLDSGGDRRGVRERWAFTRLTEHWDMPDSEREAILREAGVQDEEPARQTAQRRRHGIKDGSVVRAAADLLHPHSDKSRQRLHQLIQRFEQPESERPPSGPITWLEAVVLTFMSTPAEQLPLLIERVFHLRRLEVAHEPLWNFTTPLMRRLTSDTAAVPVLLNALNGAAPATTSPLFNSPAPMPGQEHAEAARRVFLLALILKAAGKLTLEQLATAFDTLSNADPRTVVADPFIGAVGPVHNLGATLSDGLDS